MELPDVGQRCDHADCKRLDFLPLTCPCGRSFCGEHYREHAEVCGRVERTAEARKAGDAVPCSEPNCKAASVVPFECERCGGSYCVAHRHVVDCNRDVAAERDAAVRKMRAPVEQFERAKAEVDRQVEANLSQVQKKRGGSDTARKVQLMRLKGRAIGPKTVPSDDRVYFAVRHPASGGEKTTPVFVSKRWTVGRAIDAVAETCKVRNDNNRVDRPKLRLYKEDGGGSVGERLSDTIEEVLVGGTLFDGECLVLEYVV